jgi:hypothetical protein
MATADTARETIPLTHDEKVQVRTYWDLGWRYKAIAKKVKCTIRQVGIVLFKYHFQIPSLEPARQKDSRGRKPLLNTPKRRKLVRFLHKSKKNRQMRWELIPQVLDLGIPYGITTLITIIRKEGFHRHRARVRPILTETNKQKRLEFALSHENWGYNDWAKIL